MIVQADDLLNEMRRTGRHHRQNLVMTDLAKLRAQIAAGKYRVDADSIASAMLDYANIVEVPPPPARDPASAPLGHTLAGRKRDQNA